MQRTSRIANLRPSLLRISSLAFACALGAVPRVAMAQAGNAGLIDPGQSLNWQPPAIAHDQRMRQYRDLDNGTQPTPPIIPRFELDVDPSGVIGTFQPGGATITTNNAFFQNLGTNERTCFTCHQPATGWTVSAASVQARFLFSRGSDPIFRLVDGATCPTDNVSTPLAKLQAYKLLLDKGLIRIGLAIPTPAPPLVLQFEVTHVADPYNCTTNPATGLTSPTAGIMSMYRRPLPSTNLGFLSTIMWDGREPSFASQAIDATLGHAQAAAPPSAAQVAEIVAFETGVFTAQDFDRMAQDLHDAGATGGPVALSLQLSNFFIGVNDPLGNNPHGTPFNPAIFDLYKPWLGLSGGGPVVADRESIARGEEVFNNTVINITGVNGLNDVLNQPSISGFCGTCHDTPNVGDHSIKAPLNIGVANAGVNSPPALDISGLPVFTLQCTQGPLAGQTFTVTDPGRAMISGNCADIGKVKGPILRGLAARAPYFHNGSAATLMDVVNFYDQRFNIGFTNQQKQDLVNFLNAL
jgi:cytochrome c peroxidase